MPGRRGRACRRAPAAAAPARGPRRCAAPAAAPRRAAPPAPRRRRTPRRRPRASALRRSARSPCSALLGAGAYLALQSVYFIGTNNRGLVTLYQGRALSRCPGNLALYSSHYVSGVSASTLTPRTPRSTLLDHSLRSEGDGRLADPQPRTRPARMRRRAVNRPIVRLYGLVVAAVRAARRVHLALDGLRSLLAARQPRSTRARCSSRSGSTAARSSPPTAPCSRAACAAPKASTNARYPTGSLFAPRGRLLLHRPRQRRASSASATPS